MKPIIIFKKLLIYLFILFFTLNVKCQLLPLKIYYTEDGLASSQVWSITEDKHGYIWMGCSSGISRFNGFKFVTFRLKEGLPSESINKLVSSQSGIVVALTIKGLAYIENQGEKFKKIPHIGETTDIAIVDTILEKQFAKTTPLLFAAVINRGIFSYNFDTGKWKYIGFKEFNPVSLNINGNNIVFASLNGNLYQLNLKNKKIELIGQTEKISKIKNITKDKLLLISEKAIYLLKNKTIKKLAKTQGEEEIFFDGTIDSRGTLWIASNFGLRKIVNGRNILYTSKNGVPGIRVLSTYESKDGILWFGTNHGVCKLISEDILVYVAPEKGSALSYISFYYQTETNTMMVGTTSGVILIKDNKVTPLKSRYISRFPVWAITKDENNNFYFATEGGGVVKKAKSGKEVHFRAENGCLPGNNATDLRFTKNKLYVSCKKGFAVYNNGKWKIYNLYNGLPVSYVRCLEKYKETKILLGTLGKGIIIYNNGKFSPLLKNTPEELKSVYDIFYDKKNDIVWAATNYGLAKIKNGKFTLYSTQNGFLPYGLSAVYPARHYLWIGSDGGAQLFDIKKERVVKILTKDDGLPGNEFTTHNAITKDNQNNIWFGFFGGAAKLSNLGLTETTMQEFNPKIFITSIKYYYKGKTFYKKFISEDNIEIPYGAKEIFIAFDIIWFRNEYSLNLEYKLQNINTNWNKLKEFKDIKIYFTSISPGNHPLYIRISSILGNKKLTKKMLELYIPKPWWEKPAYILLIGIIFLMSIIGIVYGYSIYKTKKLREEKENLNKLVKKRTIQLDNLNKELEEKNKILKELANHDYLTGLFNRRYFMNKLDTIHSIALREKEFILCIIIFDIDNFKNINDSYGHLAGDEVLKTVAKIIQKNLRRKTDMAARYGGEEFIVALPRSNKDAAKTIAENIRQEIESTIIQVNGLKLSVTISGGLHCFELSSTKENKLNKAIEQADKKLYLAKKLGKNRIEG